MVHRANRRAPCQLVPSWLAATAPSRNTITQTRPHIASNLRTAPPVVWDQRFGFPGTPQVGRIPPGLPPPTPPPSTPANLSLWRPRPGLQHSHLTLPRLAAGYPILYPYLTCPACPVGAPAALSWICILQAAALGTTHPYTARTAEAADVAEKNSLLRHRHPGTPPSPSTSPSPGWTGMLLWTAAACPSLHVSHPLPPVCGLGFFRLASWATGLAGPPSLMRWSSAASRATP